MNELTQAVLASCLSENQALDLLQEHGAVSDLCQKLEDVAEADRPKAIETLKLHGPKPRFPRSVAAHVALDLLNCLAPHCERLEAAGSYRRGKSDVGDLELLFIPKFATEPAPLDMFATAEVNLADRAIRLLESDGILERRLSVNGREAYGPKNKLMRHRATGLPVDLFTATKENWFNYLVCRTGPADSNMRICTAAQDKGWKWNPYSEGFSRHEGLGNFVVETVAMHSEREVFEFVGLPYRIPEDR